MNIYLPNYAHHSSVIQLALMVHIYLEACCLPPASSIEWHDNAGTSSVQPFYSKPPSYTRLVQSPVRIKLSSNENSNNCCTMGFQEAIFWIVISTFTYSYHSLWPDFITLALKAKIKIKIRNFCVNETNDLEKMIREGKFNIGVKGYFS